MFGIKRTKADALFSDLIRELAGWQCERCKKEFEKPNMGLHCSHYHSRRNKSVRWDRENAASLCFACHRYFTENPHDHAEFFIRRLGQARYDALSIRAKIAQKADEKLICIWLRMELQAIKENKKVLRGYK